MNDDDISYMEELVRAAPPLTQAQKHRIAALLDASLPGQGEACAKAA